MRNKNIARILRGDGGNPRSEQRRNAQAHIIYYMCPPFVFTRTFGTVMRAAKGQAFLQRRHPKTKVKQTAQRTFRKDTLPSGCIRAITPNNLHRQNQTGNKDTACAKQRRDHFAKTHCQSAACAKAAVKDNAKKWAPPEPD